MTTYSHHLRWSRRTSRRVVLAVLLALTLGASACSSTTQANVEDDPASAAASGEAAAEQAEPGTAESGATEDATADDAATDGETVVGDAARIAFGVYELGDPGLSDQAQGLIDALVATRPADAPELIVDVVPWESFWDQDCESLIPAEGEVPAVLITDYAVGAELGCHTQAGIPVISYFEATALSDWLAQNQPTVRLPQGVSLTDAATALTQAIQADPASVDFERIGIFASASFSFEAEWEAGLADVGTQLGESLGVDVSTYLVPPFDGSPSWDAEVATIPVQMKADGIDAIVAIAGTDALFFDPLNEQALDVPLYTPSPFAVDIPLSYPNVTLLAPNQLTVGPIDGQRVRVDETETGQQCEGILEADGVQVDDFTWWPMLNLCSAMQIVLAAEAADAAALTSGEAFLSALDAAPPVTRPSGLNVDFNDGSQTGSVEFALWVTDPACSCLVETDTRYTVGE